MEMASFQHDTPKLLQEGQKHAKTCWAPSWWDSVCSLTLCPHWKKMWKLGLQLLPPKEKLLECETALTSEYETLFLYFVFRYFCLLVFFVFLYSLSFCIFCLFVFFVFLYFLSFYIFCLFVFFVFLSLWSSVWRVSSLKSHSLYPNSKVALIDWLTHSLTKVRDRAARAAKQFSNQNSLSKLNLQFWCEQEWQSNHAGGRKEKSKVGNHLKPA